MSITESPADVDASPLVRMLRERVAGAGDDWLVHADEAWCHARPSGYRPRPQGWKLHVSATVESAPAVLARALEVMLPARCAFKFASTPRRVRELNGIRYDRGGAGKFITVYPVDDAQFRRLAERLHRATAGLPGPAVLSDRAYRPGSLVHYRYGAFQGRQLLNNDGQYLEAIAAPDGTLVEDRREAWFTAPAWAPAPLPTPVPEPGPPPDGVLLADRFVVHRAIRHANKGGVFEATDRDTGEAVVIKQARAHVGAVPVPGRPAGWDARDTLRNEAAMLDRLAPLGAAPRCLAVFEQGGDLFLAQERVAGTNFAQWRAGVAADGPVLPWATVADVAHRLVDLLAAVHANGLVVRDLSPTNVMVRPDGSLGLVDLEFAAAAGAAVPPVGTPGYAAPEQLAGAAAAPDADRYALGALLWLLVVGGDPVLPDNEPDEAGGRPGPRQREWLTLIAAGDEVVCRAAPLLNGLLQPAPERRWGLDRVRRFLRTPPAPRPVSPPRYDLDRLLADGIDHLLTTLTPDGDRLWPVSRFGAASDAVNVQNGAAGVLATLTWVAGSADDSASIRDAMRTACGWIERRLARDPAAPLLPGLYFGRAGTAWALYDAAERNRDGELAARAVDLARRLPLDWPNADVTHGLAGAGFATLHLWRATGDPGLRERARRYAGALVGRVQRRDGRLLWPVPESFDSVLAGLTDWGFAHGTAGVASYLLAAGVHLDEPAWVGLAAEAGQTLARVAVPDGDGARWTSGPRDDRPLEHWCSGSAGIGTFLLRLARHTGDETAYDLAERAASSVWRRRFHAGTAVCHGLAGGGEFLLDLAQATGEARYLRWAEDLAAALAARAATRHGRLLAADETYAGFGADYGVGVAGWVGFLLRLRDRGPNHWMVDR